MLHFTLKELSRIFRRRFIHIVSIGTGLTLFLVIYSSLTFNGPKPIPPKAPLVVLKELSNTAGDLFLEKVNVILYSPDPNKTYNFSTFITSSPQLDESLKAAVNYKTQGYFVEVGAGDGQTRSLTLALEIDLSWTGLLLEADEEQAVKLLNIHRKAYMSFECVSPLHFFFVGRFVSNGLLGSRLLSPNETELGKDVKSKKCYPLSSFLDALMFPNIDFLAIDINGNEMSLLRTLPLNRYNIDMIATRYDGSEQERAHYEEQMNTKGYELTGKTIGHNYLLFKKRDTRRREELALPWGFPAR